ncbi:hypothetical protein MTR67_042007 [Solanum verrucosum]|uniref:Uncharacterized protein n=1 Tax=Solanum verrucosum TaxID=315347 RepID=A0AAF0ULR4_SOLVR|nr:hypothetical protein MTR67_042007 [Solanum verrucosum]
MGVLEWVKVPHWFGNGLVVSLYGLGQSSPHELAFGVELGPSVISLQFDTAEQIWTSTKHTYSCKDNDSQIFEIRNTIYVTKQGDMLKLHGRPTRGHGEMRVGPSRDLANIAKNVETPREMVSRETDFGRNSASSPTPLTKT